MDKRCNLLFSESKGFKTVSQFYLIDFVNFEKSMLFWFETSTFQHAKKLLFYSEKVLPYLSLYYSFIR